MENSQPHSLLIQGNRWKIIQHLQWTRIFSDSILQPLSTEDRFNLEVLWMFRPNTPNETLLIGAIRLLEEENNTRIILIPRASGEKMIMEPFQRFFEAVRNYFHESIISEDDIRKLSGLERVDRVMENNVDKQNRNDEIVHKFEYWQKKYYDDVNKFWEKQDEQRLIPAFQSWENRFRKFLKGNFSELCDSYDSRTSYEFPLKWLNKGLRSFKETKSYTVEQFLAQCIEDAQKGNFDVSYIGPETEEKKISQEPLPEELAIRLGKDFEIEIKDLRHNFGFSGTCTAFLLRKILEKLIFLAFSKNGQRDKLEDSKGKLVGLDSMLKIATKNTINGQPFLMMKTAQEVQGMKFLGDTAAHNPLSNVSMQTIISQLPFIMTAYSELAKRI